MNLKNYIIWTLTDGSEGMISQVLGLAQELGDEIVEIKTDLIFPWSKLQPGILPTFKWIFKNKIPTSPQPDIVISCGRKSVYLSNYLKNKNKNIINIHIQNPKISFNKFNYVIAPNHDGIAGNNIINSTGALHKFSPNMLSTVENTYDIPKKNLVTCIFGGKNQHYNFNKKEADDLCYKIKNLKKNNPKINLLIITSRRTNLLIKKIIKEKLGNISKIWLGQGQNPYKFAIKFSRCFIITSDSTSMISESAISGKPIYIYHLPYKRNSRRFEKFHNEFSQLNITKKFSNDIILYNWTYKPLYESKRIARIINERITIDKK